MPASVHLDRGQGPVVVLLHGVGVGPESFAEVAELLEDKYRVIVLARPDGGSSVGLLESNADHIASTIEAVGAVGCRIVGVSGGATLGVLIAHRHPELATGYLLHEPLLGRLAPALHQRFQAAAAMALASHLATMDVVRGVMGEATWATLGAEAQARSSALAARWQTEIAAFAAFDPSVASLAALARVPVVASVGGRSGPERREVASVLQRLANADLAVVPDAGNAVQLDQPLAFARLIAMGHVASIGSST